MCVGLGAAYLLQIPLERDWPGEPFLFFLLLVIGTTLCFGTRLGLISAALSVFLSPYFFEPVGSPTLRYASDLNKIALYAIIAFGCVGGFAYFADTLMNRSNPDNNKSILLRIPAAIYMTDAEGRITFYNEAAAALWGCRPELGDSKFCGSWKLYRPDGTPLPHDECPMALALGQRRPIRGMEAVAERPDGTRISFISYPTPLFDENGRLTGAVNMLVDISERKRAEADLAERQAQLAVFVKHAPVAIAMFDCEMRYLAVSRRFAVDYRLPLGEQIIGRSHYEVFPDIPQRWRDIHARVLAGEELSHNEDPFLRPDGRTDWVRWLMTPWRKVDGSVGGALLFAEVRTEQVEARRALDESEARFRAAFENAAVGIVLVDPKGSLLRVNDTFARMLGYSTKELETKTFQDVTHPDDLATNLSVFNKTLVGEAESYCIEKRYVHKDGRFIWASLNVGCVRKLDGAVDYFLSVIEDITDRKLAEVRLAERNMQLELAARAALVGSYVYDVNMGMTQVSQGYAAIHGLPEGTTEAPISEWRARVHPEDLTRAEWVREQAFADRRKEDNAEYRIILSNGEVRWIERRGAISYGENGRPERVVGVNIDVTERKRAEQALVERNILLALAGTAARVGTFAYDTDTEIMQISEDYAAIHGVPEGTVKLARSECLAGAHPEDLEGVRLARSEAFQDRRNEYSAEYRIIRPGGEVRWIKIRCFIAYDDKGHPRRVVGVSIDVTDRKQAELRLSERNAQFGLAQKATRVGTYTYDNIERTMQLSEASAAILGLPQGTTAMNADDWRLRVHPNDVQRLAAERRHAFKEQQPDLVGELRIIWPTGEVRWIEARALITYDGDGRPCSMIGVYIDVTERKRVEQILAEHNLQLALAGRVGRVGSYAYDVRAEKLQVSEGYAALHGLPEGATETTLSEWRARVHPEDLHRVEGAHNEAVADKRREYSAEYRIIIRSTGEVRWIERRCLISYDGDARPQRVVGVSIDVTERKRAEEARKLLNAELDHRVKNALATITAVISHTRQRNRSVAEFAAALEGRICSMATTHELLSSRHWQELSLIELVRRELAPYATSDNVEINGPDVNMKAEAGQVMGMVLHELVTNAAKYGALSTRNGRVSIRWRLRSNGHTRSHLVLEWREFGGPSVVPPGNTGFGTSTIRDVIPYELGGTADLTFVPEGVQCRLELPADWLGNDCQPFSETGAHASSRTGEA